MEHHVLECHLKIVAEFQEVDGSVEVAQREVAAPWQWVGHGDLAELRGHLAIRFVGFDSAQSIEIGQIPTQKSRVGALEGS